MPSTEQPEGKMQVERNGQGSCMPSLLFNGYLSTIELASWPDADVGIRDRRNSGMRVPRELKMLIVCLIPALDFYRR